jgi:hypothetical protein
MPSSVGRELKRSVGDRLRGVRYLVRVLGSDQQRSRLAPPALPDVLPPEFDRLLGKTFRAVDNVMTAVETTIRPPAGAFRGFIPLDAYAAAEHHGILQEDIYKALKATASIGKSHHLILKSRVADVQADMLSRRCALETREERCVEMLLALTRRSPLVDMREDAGGSQALKHYVAVALLFGLAGERLPESEALLLAEDALLLANTRLDILSANLKAGKSRELLVSTLAVLLGHLA